jgi:hypothetical protein
MSTGKNKEIDLRHFFDPSLHKDGEEKLVRRFKIDPR